MEFGHIGLLCRQNWWSILDIHAECPTDDDLLALASLVTGGVFGSSAFSVDGYRTASGFSSRTCTEPGRGELQVSQYSKPVTFLALPESDITVPENLAT
eukprot:s1771_g14.t1